MTKNSIHRNRPISKKSEYSDYFVVSWRRVFGFQHSIHQQRQLPRLTVQQEHPRVSQQHPCQLRHQLEWCGENKAWDEWEVAVTGITDPLAWKTLGKDPHTIYLKYYGKVALATNKKRGRRHGGVRPIAGTLHLGLRLGGRVEGGHDVADHAGNGLLCRHSLCC